MAATAILCRCGNVYVNLNFHLEHQLNEVFVAMRDAPQSSCRDEQWHRVERTRAGFSAFYTHAQAALVEPPRNDRMESVEAMRQRHAEGRL